MPKFRHTLDTLQAQAVKDNFAPFLMPLIVGNKTYKNLKQFVDILGNLQERGCEIPNMYLILKLLNDHDIQNLTNFALSEENKESGRKSVIRKNLQSVFLDFLSVF